MTQPPSREEGARLLRQRMEMGATEVFLEGLTRAEALALVRSAGGGAPAASVGPGASASTPTAAAEKRSRTASMPRAPASRPAAPAKSTAGPAGSAATVSRSVGPASTTPGPVTADSYESLRTEALACTRCRLCEGRTQVVFSDGPSNARLMVVGEAPGAQEDATGLPFVGAAGQYLDLLLAAVDLNRRDSVYIANVLKCRPPGNRNPLPDEIEACSPFLLQQIDFVRPQAVLAVGSFSGKLLTGNDIALGKLRGRVHSYHGVPLIVTYHPAALLRNGNWTRAFWDDLQLLRSVIDS